MEINSAGRLPFFMSISKHVSGSSVPSPTEEAWSNALTPLVNAGCYQSSRHISPTYPGLPSEGPGRYWLFYYQTTLNSF